MENLDNFFRGNICQKLFIGVGPTDLDCVLLELNLLSPVGTRVGQQKIPLCEILLFLHGGHGSKLLALLYGESLDVLVDDLLLFLFVHLKLLLSPLSLSGLNLPPTILQHLLSPLDLLSCIKSLLDY